MMVVALVVMVMLVLSATDVHGQCANLDDINCELLAGEPWDEVCEDWYDIGYCPKSCGWCQHNVNDPCSNQEMKYCLPMVNGDLFMGTMDDYRRSEEAHLIVGTYGDQTTDCRFRLSIEKDHATDRVSYVILDVGITQGQHTSDYFRRIMVDQTVPSDSSDPSIFVDNRPKKKENLPYTVRTQSTGIEVEITWFSTVNADGRQMAHGWSVAAKQCCWSLIVKPPKLGYLEHEVSAFLQYPAHNITFTGPCQYSTTTCD